LHPVACEGWGATRWLHRVTMTMPTMMMTMLLLTTIMIMTMMLMML
jgi:hypothetical protein